MTAAKFKPIIFPVSGFALSRSDSIKNQNSSDGRELSYGLEDWLLVFGFSTDAWDFLPSQRSYLRAGRLTTRTWILDRCMRFLFFHSVQIYGLEDWLLVFPFLTNAWDFSSFTAFRSTGWKTDYSYFDSWQMHEISLPFIAFRSTGWKTDYSYFDSWQMHEIYFLSQRSDQL
jgi:hypothetical protein